MGSDMVAVDMLDADQIEIGDYICLQTETGAHSGEVLDINDNVSTFTITLNDDEQGESVEYDISAYDKVVLLAYESVAV